MVTVVSGYAHLHKTHVSKIGYNTCDPNDVDAKVFDINCSLACYLGEPFVYGMITYRLYREDCDGSLIGTRLFRPNMFWIQVGCPSGYDDTSPLNNTWVGSSTPETDQSHSWGWGYGFGYRIKMDAQMVAISPSLINVSISTSRLMPDLTYAGCNSISAQVHSVGISLSESDYKYYESDLIPTTFDLENCGGEVKYVKVELVLQRYRFGCSRTYDEVSPKCNLSSNRGGYVRQYSCLVCLVTPSDKISFTPQVFQMGINTLECENSNSCTCLTWNGYFIEPQSPRRDMDESMAFVGCPDEYPASNTQNIQYGESGNYRVVLKTIKDGAICVGASYQRQPWVVGTLTVLKNTNPFIMQASFSSLPGSPIFQFYGMEFPTTLIEECINGMTGPPPMEPHDAISWLRLNASTLQNEDVKPLPPSTPPDNPAILQAREMVKKIYEIKNRPCINLGMALEAAPSCGCGGGILHQCSTHGECRQAGNDTKKKLCWKCDEYSPK